MSKNITYHQTAAMSGRRTRKDGAAVVGAGLAGLALTRGKVGLERPIQAGQRAYKIQRSLGAGRKDAARAAGAGLKYGHKHGAFKMVDPVKAASQVAVGGGAAMVGHGELKNIHHTRAEQKLRRNRVSKAADVDEVAKRRDRGVVPGQYLGGGPGGMALVTEHKGVDKKGSHSYHTKVLSPRPELGEGVFALKGHVKSTLSSTGDWSHKVAGVGKEAAEAVHQHVAAAHTEFHRQTPIKKAADMDKKAYCKAHGKFDDCGSKTMPVKVKKSANPHDVFLGEEVSKAKREPNWSRGRAITAGVAAPIHGLVAGKGTGGKLKSGGTELVGAQAGGIAGRVVGAALTRGRAGGAIAGGLTGSFAGGVQGAKVSAHQGWLKSVAKKPKSATTV